MVINATYTDGGNSNVTGYTCNKTTLKYTDTSVTISYTFNGVTKTCTQSITVKRVLSSIKVSTAPSKTTYKDNESFNKTGMVITATYTDGDTEVLGYEVSPNGILSTSNTEVTISYTYNGITKTCSQSITVTPYNQYVGLYSSKNVGDTITVPHSTFGNIDFIIIGKGQDGEGKLTLLSKNIIKIMAFDAKESR